MKHLHEIYSAQDVPLWNSVLKQAGSPSSVTRNDKERVCLFGAFGLVRYYLSQLGFFAVRIVTMIRK